jgi:hypothetical protein
MKAKVSVGLIGNPNRNIGDIVEGDEALQLVTAGYAAPVTEMHSVETAEAKVPKKETRKAKAKPEPVEDTLPVDEVADAVDSIDTDSDGSDD